jgi:hypothetical protein
MTYSVAKQVLGVNAFVIGLPRNRLCRGKGRNPISVNSPGMIPLTILCRCTSCLGASLRRGYWLAGIRIFRRDRRHPILPSASHKPAIVPMRCENDRFVDQLALQTRGAHVQAPWSLASFPSSQMRRRVVPFRFRAACVECVLSFSPETAKTTAVCQPQPYSHQGE